jgi:hypothetical protein
LFARYRSLRPEDVRFDRAMRWLGALLCLGCFALALARDEVWFAVLAYFALVFWAYAIPGIRTGRRMRDLSRAERAQSTKMVRIFLGGFLLMSLPISTGQEWSQWSWQWSALYAVGMLWTWLAPNLASKRGKGS